MKGAAWKSTKKVSRADSKVSQNTSFIDSSRQSRNATKLSTLSGSGGDPSSAPPSSGEGGGNGNTPSAKAGTSPRPLLISRRYLEALERVCA